MREAGLSGVITKKYRSTTVRVPGVGSPTTCLIVTFGSERGNGQIAEITEDVDFAA